MSRAIHWLETLAAIRSVVIRGATRWNQIEIVLVVLIVARNFPQVYIVEIRCHDLFEATFSILLLNEIGESIVDMCTVWKEKGTSWRISRIPKEKLLLLAN